MSVRVGCIVLGLQIAAAAAYAGPDDTGAAAHLERGIAAYRAGEFQRAMDELLEANRQAPELAEPYRWIALTEAEIDDCRSALLNIDRFVSSVPRSDPGVSELLALRERCQSSGTVVVESTPDGAAIRVDQVAMADPTPVSWRVRVGRHTITVEKPGFESQSREVDIGPLTVQRAGFALTPLHTDSVVEHWWFWAGLGVASVALVALAYDVSGPGGHGSAGFPAVTCTSGGCQR